MQPSFRTVIFSRKSTAESSITKTGESPSSTAARDMLTVRMASL